MQQSYFSLPNINLYPRVRKQTEGWICRRSVRPPDIRRWGGRRPKIAFDEPEKGECDLLSHHPCSEDKPLEHETTQAGRSLADPQWYLGVATLTLLRVLISSFELPCSCFQYLTFFHLIPWQQSMTPFPNAVKCYLPHSAFCHVSATDDPGLGECQVLQKVRLWDVKNYDLMFRRVFVSFRCFRLWNSWS